MPTFIDESGDTGHTGSSKPYFRLAAVWFPSNVETEAFREGVRQLYPLSDFEFKFTTTHNASDRRRAFFNVALKHEFRFCVCAIDKLNDHWKNASKQEQHWASATSIAVDMRKMYHQAEATDKPLHDPIIVDDNGDSDFLAAIASAFRTLRSRLHPSSPMVRKPKFRGSKSEEALQLADMVCGATGAFLDGDPVWYKMIESRCIGIESRCAGLTKIP